MALLAWLMMGIALWHFTVFLPDRFAGGIVGAFVGASIGGVLSGLAVHGFGIPSQDDTSVLTVAEAIPGAVIGMAIVWAIGDRQERERGTAETAPRI
jgi:hypothetical protein